MEIVILFFIGALAVCFVGGLCYAYIKENRKLLKQLTLFVGITIALVMGYVYFYHNIGLG